MGGGGGLYPRNEFSSLKMKLTVTDKGTETVDVESWAPTLSKTVIKEPLMLFA
jgi:hypothetical protein